MIQTERPLQLNFNYHLYKQYSQIEGIQHIIPKILAVHLVTSFQRMHTVWEQGREE